MLLFIPGLAAAQSTDYGPTSYESVANFVYDFLNGWSQPNSKALPFIRSAINDPINFYGKSMSRDQYMKAQAAFATRWPDRSYYVEPNSVSPACNPEMSSCTVTGIEDWSDFNPARHLMSKGSANFSLSLSIHQNGVNKNPIYRITAESGSVISSETEKAIDDLNVLLGPSASSNFTPAPSNDRGHAPLVTDAAIQAAGCITSDATIDHENCVSVSEIDLTKAFHTKDRTVFELTQYSLDGEVPAPWSEPPPYSFCFVHRNMIQCQYGLDIGYLDGPDHLLGTSIIFPTKNSYYPLLSAQLLTEGGAGCGGLTNLVWAYNPANNAFNLIWSRGYDCHSALRFMTKGPLAGDMVAVDNDVTDHWPWPFGIEVYKIEPPGKLVQILYLVGRAGQGGKYVTGPNDAIDIDMPQILQHLGVSH